MLSRRGFLQLITSACVAAGIDLPPLAALEQGVPDAPIPVRDTSASPIRGLRFTSLTWHREAIELDSRDGWSRNYVPGLLRMDATAEFDPDVKLTHDEQIALNRSLLRGDPLLLDEQMMNVRVSGEFMITDMNNQGHITMQSIGPITIAYVK